MSTAIERREERAMGAVTALQSMTPEQIKVIKATVARGATDTELAMFLELANRYQLDPFAKQIWCVCDLNDNGTRKTQKDGSPKPPMIMTSRDGYLAVADRNPAYDGIHADVVCEGDTFAVRMHGTEPPSVEHTYGLKRGNIIGAYALVFRRDRSHPAYFFAPWKDYGAGPARASQYSSWAKYPSAMIVKVAESMALKRAFSISGLVTTEEMEAGDVDPPPRENLQRADTVDSTAVQESEPAEKDPGAIRWEALSDEFGAESVGPVLKEMGVAKFGDLTEAVDAAARERLTADRTKQAPVVHLVPSESDPAVTHKVTISADGTATCSCKAFEFAPDPKTCKHIAVVASAPRPAEQATPPENTGSDAGAAAMSAGQSKYVDDLLAKLKAKDEATDWRAQVEAACTEKLGHGIAGLTYAEASALIKTLTDWVATGGAQAPAPDGGAA